MSEENEHKKSDIMKFEDVLQHYRNRRKKLEAYINQDKQQIAADSEYVCRVSGSLLMTASVVELDNRRREHEKLLSIVAQQNMSPEEVARMTHEHESLQRNLEEMTKKNAEISQSARGREITMAIRMESIEHAIDEYTNFLHRLGLAPKVLPPLPPADLRIETYFASSNLNELVKRKADSAGVDFKSDIMPALHAIGFFKRQRRQESEDELLTASNELDQVNQECERKEDETGEVEGKVARVEQEAKDLHDVGVADIRFGIRTESCTGSAKGGQRQQHGGCEIGEGAGERESSGYGFWRRSHVSGKRVANCVGTVLLDPLPLPLTGHTLFADTRSRSNGWGV